ncbi:MAG: aldehyde dehydrogenase family protein [Acidobacteriota bacterium]|nr:aldehyde dehydrogenase family protein [Acidobacteriota bacterium]
MRIGSKLSAELEGRSIIGESRGAAGDKTFKAIDPRDGSEIGPVFYSALDAEVERAAELADSARREFAELSNKRRSGFLSAIAENLESVGTALVRRAALETGLPETRFEGELERTCGQIRMFAKVVSEGSWVDARIDRAIADRKPLPKPDIRSMLHPLGPVAVFCATNFPLAFSVAGGDTASAFAAGCPVIVIANKAHPGTAEIAAKAIAKAVSDMGLEEGVFSLIFSDGYAAGQSLVSNPLVKAVGFTGSRKGGRALIDIAAARPEPVPVFAEMSSINPIFLLPGAIAALQLPKDYMRRLRWVMVSSAQSRELSSCRNMSRPGLLSSGSSNSRKDRIQFRF